MHAVKVTVTGKVQGVFFRASAKKKAISLGLFGWAENKTDDSVEVVAYGDRNQLNQFVKWLGVGPMLAKVKSVRVKDIDVDPDCVSFTVR